MFNKSETDLLNSLMNAMGKTTKTKPLTNNELAEIEKYRDKNGVIDVTGIKDFDKMKYIVDLVDRKNELKEENEENMDEFIQELTDSLLSIAGIDNARIMFTTPETSIQIETKKGEEPKVSVTKSVSTDCQKCNDKKEEVKTSGLCQCNELNECSCDDEKCTCNTNSFKKFEENFKPEIKALFDEDEKIPTVVVHNAGGMLNEPFYNAVKYICEIEHFPNADVYTDYDNNVFCYDNVVLIPNMWNKIYEDAAIIFGKQIIEGQNVYIINPISFEIKHITDPMELWDYVMDPVQERCNN